MDSYVLDYKSLDYRSLKFSNLSYLMTRNSRLFSDKSYIYFHDKVYTYAQAEAEVIKTANVLVGSGIKPGDRVLIYMINSPEYIFAYYGIMRMGGVAVPVNHFLKGMELSSIITDSGAKGIITTPAFNDVIANLVRKDIPSLERVFTYTDAPFESINISAQTHHSSELYETKSREEIAALIYTSGTTGKSKGVMLTHKNLIRNGVTFTKIMECVHDDIHVSVLPMFHSYASMASIVTPLLTVNSLVVLESVMETNKDSYKKMLQKIRPTIITAVPQVYATMSRKKVMEDMPYRLYISGGAPLAADTLRQFDKMYGVPLIEGYGLSEASPVVCVNTLSKRKVGTIGPAGDGVEIKSIDETGNALPLGSDKSGELCVRGENIMKGYWNQREETDKVLSADGWLRTGDVCTIDSDGFVTIVDRIKDLIIVKGMNVYPREIEEVLTNHESVLLASVVGVPDETGSERIVAYVSINPEKPVATKELRDYLQANLANFKLPRAFVITNDIPINASGKILKRELRDRAKKEFSK